MVRKSRRLKKSQKIDRKVRKVFSVRFSRDELDRLRSEADARGGSVAGTVRSIVLDAMSQPRLRTIILGANTEARFRAYVSGQGETLNAA